MPSYELTKSNSVRVLHELEYGTSIVLHHMNGCIHCEMFMPVWKEICKAYKNKEDYILVSVEYSNSSMLPQTMQNVQGFPTIRAYKNAKPIAEFNDNRTYDAVVKFIEQYGKNKPHVPPPAKKQRGSRISPTVTSAGAVQSSKKTKNAKSKKEKS